MIILDILFTLITTNWKKIAKLKWR